jgi:hypothetical protein
MQHTLVVRSQPTPVAHVGFPELSNTTLVGTFPPSPLQVPPPLPPEEVDPPLDPPSSPVEAGGLELLLQAENTQAPAARAKANVGVFRSVSMGCLSWMGAQCALQVNTDEFWSPHIVS